MNKAIFLDRDGVLNEPRIIDGKPFPPTSLEEMVICKLAFEATSAFKDHGFLNIVVTNQPDVARKRISRDTVEELNGFLFSNLPLDHIEVCYHDDGDACFCRKPKCGMLLKSSEKFNIDLSQSFMVGDRWRDIEAGQSAGCKTIFINRNYNEPVPKNPSLVVDSLFRAVDFILEKPND